MKIGFDGRFIRNKQTGNGVSAQLLLDALADLDSKNDYRVYLLEQCSFPCKRNFHLKTMRGLHANSHMRFLFTFALELLRYPVDVYHAIFTVPFLPYRTGAKIVLTLPEIPWSTPPDDSPTSTFFSSQVQLTTRYSIGKADRVISLTDFMKKRIVSYFGVPEKKVDVIPWGVDERFFTPADGDTIYNVKEKLSIKRPYVLCVGDLHPRNNQATLIKAYRYLRERYNIPLQLVLIGRPLYKAKDIYDLAASCPTKDSIIFSDRLEFEELRALYQAASVFVFPSLHEGFGLSVHEAMASGLPVITSARESLPEVVGDAALFVDPLDPESIGQTVLKVLETPTLREALVKRGFEQVKRFSWKDSARKLLALYSEVYSEPREARC